MAWNLDINTASIDELEKFPFIGRQRAQAIISYREEHGFFKDWDEVKNIPGFSESLVDSLKNQGFTLGKKAA